MAGIRWSKKDDNFLIKNYENLEINEICNSLSGRSWDAIKMRAEKMNIRRYNKKGRFVNLDILIKEKNESYYWIGFIMADGHIHNKSRLKICLSIKDIEHLKEFKNFLKYSRELTIKKNGIHKNVSISIMDTKYLNILSEKFDIKHNKTYNQCDISKIKNDNLLLSLIVGFIDGDGSIKNQSKGRKDFRLNIKCHKSWEDNLDYILKTIIRLTGENCDTDVKKTKCGKYSYITITNSVVLKELKRKIMQLNIPYMKRKWDIIDLDYMGKYEKSINDKKLCLDLFNKNYKVKEIVNELNLKEGVVYKYIREFKRNDL